MPRTNRRRRHLLSTIVLTIVRGGCLAGVDRGRDVRGVDGDDHLVAFALP
jgi:hypothetical protein